MTENQKFDDGADELFVDTVLTQTTFKVEGRIALFRLVLTCTLLIASVGEFGLASVGQASPSFTLLVVGSALAILYSVGVLVLTRKPEGIRVGVLSLVSIGVDATLMCLPVVAYFAAPTGVNELVSTRPATIALYLMVVASGLRFREAARIGILINATTLFTVLTLDFVKANNMSDPTPYLAELKQSLFLLVASCLLAQLVSVQTRETVFKSAQIAEQATTDPLTKARNRRFLRGFLDRAGEEARRNSTPLSLVMTDIDHFKGINDQHGHPVGDAVLAEVALRLQLAVRHIDVVARYGGEEFCVVLPTCALEDAAATAERIRQAVASEPVEGLEVTISLGVAQLQPKMNVHDFIASADRALYLAKTGGRNRVVTAGE